MSFVFSFENLHQMTFDPLLNPEFIYTDDQSFCIKRIKRGKGFSYLDIEGNVIKNPKILKRIKSLAIPPMWTDVRLCTIENGHLQAVGRDSKGRKQYIYHPGWALLQQNEKFSRMYEFGKSLPKFRKKVIKDLEETGWPKNKILGLMVLILDETGIRIGNKSYLQENGTYGLSTLRRKHLVVEDRELIFRFIGKSKQKREVSIEDEELISHIKKIAELPGYEIFKYHDSNGKIHTIDSNDVNSYIYAISKRKFSSKDFRTWVASRVTIESIPEAQLLKNEHPRKKLSNLVLRLVAKKLGNTVSVCKSYYIHPKLLLKLENNEIPEINAFKSSKTNFGLSAEEKLLLDLIKD
jgi:DNA topoisomerase I